MPFAFDSALIAIKKKGYAEDLYIDDTVYGPLPHILAGHAFAEVLRNMDLGPVWTGVDPYVLNAASRVRSALFADWGEFKTQNSIRILTTLGWEINEKFPHPATKSDILYFLTRH